MLGQFLSKFSRISTMFPIAIYNAFYRQQCFLQASALTFYTLIALVPLLALTLAMAKGFQLHQYVISQLEAQFQGQEAALDVLFQFADALLKQTQSAVMTSAGIILMIWSVLKVIGHIEVALNEIWQVEKNRHWLRKWQEYLSLLIIIPLMLALANSASIYLTHQFSWPFLAHVIPITTLALLFSWIYYFLPNTTPQVRSCLIAGLLAGVAYHFSQSLYVEFQISIAKLGAVYGSFIALPLLMMWLYLSWVIFLFGAHLSFAHHYRVTHPALLSWKQAPHRYQLALQIKIYQYCLKAFQEAHQALTIDDISKALELPALSIALSLQPLLDANLLIRLDRSPGRMDRFIPAHTHHQLTAKQLAQKLELQSPVTLPAELQETLANYYHALLH